MPRTRNINLLLSALALTLPLAGTRAVLFNSNTTIAEGNTTYDEQPIVVSNCTLTVNGPHRFASLLLTNNAVLTHSAAPNGETNNRLDLSITGDVTVPVGCRIDADGRGYAVTNAPGAGVSAKPGGGGGGHGGVGGGASGGVAGGDNYGDVLNPLSPGSPGGNSGSRLGGAGGGLIRLAVGGTMRLDGAVQAEGLTPGYGLNEYPGGGAGGGVLLSVGTLSGGGSISANGAPSPNTLAGGGAGGRIALYFDTNAFTGTVSAVGGSGSQYGGAGTIYFKTNSAAAGELLVANTAAGAVTPMAR